MEGNEMKKTNRILAVVLTVAALFCMTGFTVNAATVNVFEGFSVTVLDQTTPAVSVTGRTTDRNVMCFMSADDREVGAISYSDYNSIVQKNRKVVNLPGGGTYGVPPVDGISWEDWFADEFNKYRSLDAGSRNEADQSNTDETIEEYRQEVIRLVNEEREKAGLPTLYADEKAMEYAQERAQEITISFSHTRPNGLEKPFDEIGVMNENIADGNWGYTTPAGVMYRWMESPGHRANILNKDAYAIGVGCYRKGNALMWVQEFLW